MVGLGRTPGTSPGPRFLACLSRFPARPAAARRRRPIHAFDSCAAAGSGGFRLPAPAPAPRSPLSGLGRRARRRPQSAAPRGGPPGSSIGGSVSDFALAPLRGLDVQTSPERAEREGPARGRRRREAPLLKGAGRVPPLGRTRGRKGPSRGCERPQGEQPRAGLRFGPPRRGRAGAGLRAGAGGRGRQGTLRRGVWRPAARPLPRGPREAKAKASRRRGLCSRGGGWPGGRRAGRPGLLSGAPPGPRAAHAAGTPRRLLKSGPRATLFPLFCYIVGAERMSERAADDVRGEPRRAAAAAGGAAAAAARQQQQQPPQPQRQPPPPRRLRPEDSGPGAASTSAAAAMATVGERRPLPSPEAMLGQSWNLWVEASKLPGKDGECARPPPRPARPPRAGPLPRAVRGPRGGQRCCRSVGGARCPHLLRACVSLRHTPRH